MTESDIRVSPEVVDRAFKYRGEWYKVDQNLQVWAIYEEVEDLIASSFEVPAQLRTWSGDPDFERECLVQEIVQFVISAKDGEPVWNWKQ
jgi:hypothetical protein